MNFSFIHITDHHLAESEIGLINGFSPGYAFRSVMRHIAHHFGDRIDFIFTTGDVVDHPSEASYRSFRQMLNMQDVPYLAPGPLRISMEGLQDLPMYLLPGNHGDRNNFFQYLFPGSRPMPLMNAVFVHKDTQFICLDWGPDSKAIAHAATLDFLTRSLETDSPSIILMHHQLVTIGSRWLDDFIAEDVDHFWRIVRGRKVLGVFCGHVHNTYEGIVENIPIFGLRSTAFPFVLQDEPLACLLPPHYRFVMIRDGVLTSRIFEVPL